MSWSTRFLALIAVVAGSGCTGLSTRQAARADAVVTAAQSTRIDCGETNACAIASPLRDIGAQAFAGSGAGAPRHQALLLESGSDALLARIHLIRTATTRIDLQTYIFDEDDAGRLVLDELVGAAKRGVKVRVLMDQLSALKRVDSLASLAGAHKNLEVRVYNPVLGRARINYAQYVLAGVCCWRKLNHRMHSKLLLVDTAVGIAGGRNYQNSYFDWDREYNFRDRDVLVAGPVARVMDADFLRFWTDTRSVPVAHLADVGKRLIRQGAPAWAAPEYEQPARAAAMVRDAMDAALVGTRLVSRAIAVDDVGYVSDAPGKVDNAAGVPDTSQSLRALIESAEREVMLQTPYLVLSKPAQDLFRTLHDRDNPPRVIVSTNSLASTDAFIAYALSHKYKRRYLREFGFNIYEYKPFPLDAPVDIAATGAAVPAFDPASAEPPRSRPVRDRASVVRTYSAPLSREYGAQRFARRRANEPVTLRRAGVRIGMHAKSLVIDERVGVVGTHNFDPRGDRHNTESAVVIAHPVFARALADSIRRDIAPANSWVIAPREATTPFTGLEYSLAKVSEYLPLFDLWPVRYATSYEFVASAQCTQPLPPDHPGFRDCYRAIGDFPEVNPALKGLPTRIFTAFGAGLAPIL